MPPVTITIELTACLIVDNNVLSTLAEYCCEHVLPTQPAAQKVPHYKQWMGDILENLSIHAPDQCLHSSQSVIDEFTPSGAFYAGLAHHERQHLLGHVRSLLQAHPAKEYSASIPILRTLPSAPRRLVGPGGVSDNDLSLAALGAALTQHQARVYVLTHDQDLLAFISWLRAQPEARRTWPNLQRLQAYHGLSYIENVHRSCRISTAVMQDLLQFALKQHYQRPELAGSQKGEVIMKTLMDVYRSLVESVEHKTTASHGATP